MKTFAHKKSLGQNFLTNTSVIDHIVAAADIMSDDVVVEVGPGQGVLTELLAQTADTVIAIELDDRLIPILEEKFKNDDHVHIVHGDILHMNLSEILHEHIGDEGVYKVVANIPYYITAPIIRLFLEHKNSPQTLILMVQKEVAERLCAHPGNMSVLAIAAQYYANVSYMFTVPREDFDPVPAVDSAVVRLRVHDHVYADIDIKNFFRVVRIGFSARRKTLVNNLANGLHMQKNDVVQVLRDIGISENARAQEISLEAWERLTHALVK